MTVDASQRPAAFTLVETLIGVAVFGLFMGGLLTVWNFLGTSALNTTSYAQRQNDQMRVLDYLKRDIRRATKVELYNDTILITDTTTFASELRLTIPDYYSDSREEDNAIGTKTANTPVATSGTVTYGTALTVRYHALDGACVRDESGTLRTVASASGEFALTFRNEAGGAIRFRVVFDQPMRGGSGRKLRRWVDTLCIPRSELQQ